MDDLILQVMRAMQFHNNHIGPRRVSEEARWIGTDCPFVSRAVCWFRFYLRWIGWDSLSIHGLRAVDDGYVANYLVYKDRVQLYLELMVSGSSMCDQ